MITTILALAVVAALAPAGPCVAGQRCHTIHFPFIAQAVPRTPPAPASWATVLTVPGAVFTSAIEAGGVMFVSTQDGRIYRAGNLWADMRAEVDPTGEGGLNSMAADAAAGKTIYAFGVNRARRLTLWRVSLNNPADRAQIWDAGPAGKRHNAGGLLWQGSALFIGIGDQAPASDQDALAALRADSVVGKIIHFVPDAPPDAQRAEVYASGFRNPWALAWQGGALLAVDVGEQQVEELNRIQRGAAYGWPCYEGLRPYIYAPEVCATTVNTPPVFAYGRDRGRAIVGIGQGVVVDFSGAVMDYVTGAEVGRVPNAPVSAAYQSLPSGGLYVMTFEAGVARLHLFR